MLHPFRQPSGHNQTVGLGQRLVNRQAVMRQFDLYRTCHRPGAWFCREDRLVDLMALLTPFSCAIASLFLIDFLPTTTIGSVQQYMHGGS